MLEVGGGLDLLEEARGADDRRELRIHHLDGDSAIVPRVVGEIHGGHATSAQLALKGVAAGHGLLESMKRISHEAKIWTDRGRGEPLSPALIAGVPFE